MMFVSCGEDRHQASRVGGFGEGRHRLTDLGYTGSEIFGTVGAFEDFKLDLYDLLLGYSLFCYVLCIHISCDECVSNCGIILGKCFF